MTIQKIYCGDNLLVMRRDLQLRGIKVDLVYLDPPFFTGKVQKGTWKPGAMEISYEDSKVFWGVKGHQDAPTWIKEVARMGGGAFASYLFYMRRRLAAIKKIMKDTATIYLHCDYRASHYLKIALDEIFGRKNFRNEIIWCYAGGGIPKKDFPRKHDTIFRYTKSDNYTFNVEYRPYSEGTLKVGGGRHSLTSGGKKVDTERGTPINDWWADLAKLTSYQKEWLGYPTQKPENLLERIISTSSNEGDLVLDPFCGCGTAIGVAHKLGRQWIGIDISQDACMVMENRFVTDFNIEPEITYRDPQYLIDLTPLEFEQWVNEFFQAKKPHPDKGVDGITPLSEPIQTKTHMVNYNILDQFVTSARYHPQVKKPFTHGYIISRKGFTPNAIARQDEIKEREGITIDLFTPEELLSDI